MKSDKMAWDERKNALIIIPAVSLDINRVVIDNERRCKGIVPRQQKLGQTHLLSINQMAKDSLNKMKRGDDIKVTATI